MSSKRKYNELDDSDDEEPALGKQVLPVANLPADFSGEPVDGLQYLFLVRYVRLFILILMVTHLFFIRRDARSLPQVTRAMNPYELPEPRHVSEEEDLLSTPHSALPSETWREVFVTRFRNFRKVCPFMPPSAMQSHGFRRIQDKLQLH